ncbi:MAG: tRNA (adenosine(37)-N6)-dimethylallyltransferase MiaA [Patescibacteria group bacterium]
MLRKILVIVGPTASGKTDLGIRLAKQFNGEVISVDSRTVYRGMNIGTAKPVGEKQMVGTWKIGDTPLIVVDVPHWGIDLIEPDQDYSIADFKLYAEKKIVEIVGRGKLPILVGGTGLWIDAIVDNLELPEVAPDMELRAELEKKTAAELFAQFETVDPEGALAIDEFNKRRLVRALEVCIKSGKPFSQMKSRGPAKYDAIKIGVEVDRDELRRRIDARVDVMIANGLVDEVRKLADKYGQEFPAMSGIGYRQINFFLNGKANLEAAIVDIKKDTWAFAKRQMTWFKRDPRIHWIKNIDEAIALVTPIL